MDSRVKIASNDELGKLADAFNLLGQDLKRTTVSKRELEDRGDELARANEELQSEVKERKRIEQELKQAKEIADVANRAKSDFLANISHELRTPLTHIIGFTELILGKRFGDLNSAQEENLTDVVQSSNHLLSLINDILDLAKVESGKLELTPTAVDLKKLLENSLVTVKEKAAKHGVELSSHFDSIPESIKADERKLKQILYNLLSNAVKFTSTGGSITLTANRLKHTGGRLRTRENKEIISLKKSNRIPVTGTYFVEISVTDTGIGLKKSDLLRIFNPFEQIDSSANRNVQGTGLGLSLTKNLVELHGGKIWAESAGEGKGSVFTIVIPV